MTWPIRLYLARHGRTPWNEVGRFQGCTDVPLDDVGRSQAAQLAQSLRGRVEVVVASDLARASESARIVCEVLGVPLLGLDPDLRERGYGVFEGLTRAECMAQHPEIWAAREHDRNFEPPGGEPRASVVARMQRGLERAVEQLATRPRSPLFAERQRSALVVGHGSSLRMFLEVLSQGPVESIGNMQYREVLHDGRRFVRSSDSVRHCHAAGASSAVDSRS